MSEKSIQLEPDPKVHFWWFLAGILLIPLFGIGLYIIYKKKKELSETRYKVTNLTITAVNTEYTESVDLMNIRSIDIHQRWIDKKFGLGQLQIRTDNRTLTLSGMNNPEKLSEMILTAAEAERMRLQKMKENKTKEPESKPGTKDRMDYLTGLWQQGLISEEDFEKERKHFES
ncbi:MAG: hypothetical protein JJU13_17790 [Balneolaceae bacterium]|nr:hypothetical protein [Balneolaceae bacterium]